MATRQPWMSMALKRVDVLMIKAGRSERGEV
jgi:hypothetical protein